MNYPNKPLCSENINIFEWSSTELPMLNTLKTFTNISFSTLQTSIFSTIRHSKRSTCYAEFYGTINILYNQTHWFQAYLAFLCFCHVFINILHLAYLQPKTLRKYKNAYSPRTNMKTNKNTYSPSPKKQKKKDK